MQIVMLNGGLGNQIFQYIFFRWLEVRSGEQCVIDDSAFFGQHVEHGGYELERVFSVYPKRLSSYFDSEIWAMMIDKMEQGTPVYQQLADVGMDLVMLYQPGSGKVEFSGRRMDFTAGMAPVSSPRDHYYYGYWIDMYWLGQIGGLIASELRFPPLPAGYDAAMGQAICACRNPAAIHIRRGDMVKYTGRTAEPEYFRQRIDWMDKNLAIDHYFLFSDDLDWCRAHDDALGLSNLRERLTAVEGNCGEYAYVDMQLMSLCHHRLSDVSSFSLVAGMLCRYPLKQDINRW